MKMAVSVLLLLLLNLSPLMAQLKEEQPPATDILGVWQQYVEVNEEWIYLGSFEVTKNDDVYAMRGVHVTTDIPIIESRAIKNISFDGKTWAFLSDWGRDNGGWALFKLSKVNPGLFFGYSYLNGKKISKNLWLRLEM